MQYAKHNNTILI